jgi:L-ascorbate metabolism protein UlaG (beta-lactamase superfamily)
MFSRLASFLALLLALLAAAPVGAQDRRPSHCIALANSAPGLIYGHPRARLREPLAAETVRLSYIGHAMFLLQTQGGLSAVTDYTGFLGTADFVPDVVTMNHAHDTHWTARPDPRIPHVLRGWGPREEGIDHHLDLGEMLVRNVNTDIRSSFDIGIEKNGNSIFVFEVAGLCIGHLGHLHHEPDAAQYAALGRLDVVMAAVDGGTTLDLPTMIRVLERLRASVVVPMHWFGRGSLDLFLQGIEGTFDIRRTEDTSLEISLRNLPSRPTVVVLQPRYLQDDAAD